MMSADVAIGQKIKIIRASNGAYGVNGLTGVVVSLDVGENDISTHGLLEGERGLRVKIMSHDHTHGIWNIGTHAVYEIIDTDWDTEEN